MIEETRQITASPDRVWQLVSDIEHWGELLPTMRKVERADGDGPVGVGSRFRVEQPELPRSVYEITQWEPGGGFVWEASSAGVRTTASHWLSAQDGGTRLVLGLGWSGPLAWAARLVVGTKAARMVASEADTFVGLAEGDGHAV